MEVATVGGGGGGGLEWTTGVGGLACGWTGGGGLASGNGGAVSVVGGTAVAGTGDGAGGCGVGCLGKFSWKDCWSCSVMCAFREVRSSSRICSRYCCWLSDGGDEADDGGRIWMEFGALDEVGMWIGKD